MARKRDWGVAKRIAVASVFAGFAVLWICMARIGQIRTMGANSGTVVAVMSVAFSIGALLAVFGLGSKRSWLQEAAAAVVFTTTAVGLILLSVLGGHHTGQLFAGITLLLFGIQSCMSTFRQRKRIAVAQNQTPPSGRNDSVAKCREGNERITGKEL